MAQSYFIWNGIDCRAKGIILQGSPAIVRPEERVKHVEIPGRAGDVTETEGENIFNSYIQTAGISVKGGFRVREVYNWLKGAGYVTFSGEPDRRQQARIIGAITLNKHSRNLDWWEGEVQFYCQPLKEKLNDPTVEITASGSTVINDGDVMSRPQFIVTTSATSFSITVAGTGTPADNAITVTGIDSGTRYVVDSDIMEVSKRNNGMIYTRKSTGNFPVMAVGSNTITGTGWSKIEIDRRERFL